MPRYGRRIQLMECHVGDQLEECCNGSDILVGTFEEPHAGAAPIVDDEIGA